MQIEHVYKITGRNMRWKRRCQRTAVRLPFNNINIDIVNIQTHYRISQRRSSGSITTTTMTTSPKNGIGLASYYILFASSGKPVSTKIFAQHKRLFHSVVLLTTEKCCQWRTPLTTKHWKSFIFIPLFFIFPYMHCVSCLPRIVQHNTDIFVYTIRTTYVVYALSSINKRKTEKDFMKYLPLKWRRRYLLCFFVRVSSASSLFTLAHSNSTHTHTPWHPVDGSHMSFCYSY